MTVRRRDYSSAVAIFVAAMIGNGASGADLFAPPGDIFTLTTADFSTVDVKVISIDSAGVTILDPHGDPKTIPLTKIVSISRPAKAESVSGLVLCTAGGDRLVGSPQKLDGNSIVWLAAGVGSIAVPIESCTAILRDRTTAAELSADRADDQAKLMTGDVLHGIVTDVSEKGFVITPQQGDPVTVGADAVASIFFATPPGGRKVSAAGGFIVRLIGGTAASCSAVQMADDQLTLTLPGGRPAVIPLAQATSIENVGGAVSWLSSRTPTSNVYTPFFQGGYEARFDRDVTGEPIRFNGTTYAHGIGVHSRSKLVFAVQPGDAIFRTRYALSGTASYGDVDVRVWVDEKVVHEAKDFRAGVLAPVVQADVSGAKTITLEVDFGGGYDVQDRLNWIEPAMLRTAPSTGPATPAPATQP